MKIPLSTSASIVGWGLWDRSWAKSIAIKCAVLALLSSQVIPYCVSFSVCVTSMQGTCKG